LWKSANFDHRFAEYNPSVKKESFKGLICPRLSSLRPSELLFSRASLAKGQPGPELGIAQRISCLPADR